jgi:hypothetical protein
VGWSYAQRQVRLQGVTNNTRSIILPWVEAPHLASHILGLVLRRLRRDWQAKYGRALELVETVVDSSRFKLGRAALGKLVAQPGRVCAHKPGSCACGARGGRSFHSGPVLDVEKRQVFELPRPVVRLSGPL